MDLTLTMITCPQCKGEYSPIQSDGLGYTHTCPTPRGDVRAPDIHTGEPMKSESGGILNWIANMLK